MPVNVASYKRDINVLLIPLCTLLTFFLLYLFRYADDNRLTSWRWTFASVDLVWFSLILILGLTIAYALSRFSYIEHKPCLILFFSSFAVSVIFWKEPEVIIDVSRYFTQAKHLEIYGVKYFILEWGKTINAWTDLPLIPFIYGLIFKVFGESRLYIQVFTTSLFSMTIVLTYFIGKTLWNEEIGFFAGALLLGIPYIFSQTPLLLVDVPTMFFLTLSVFTFIKAMEKGGVWIAVSSVAIFCTVFSKYSTWMMLSVLVVIFLVYLIHGTNNPPLPPFSKGGMGGFEHRTQTKEFETRSLKPISRNYIIYRGVLVALISGILIALLLFLKFDVISGQIKFLREYQMPGLKRWGESFVSTFLYQIHPFITMAALYSIYAAFRNRDIKFLIIGWLIILIVLLQVKRSRYVMIIFPMFTLMASYGLQQIKAMELRRYVVSCIVVSSLVIAIFAYLPFLQSMSLKNLQMAGEFLDSIDGENIEVFTLPSKESVVNPAVSVPVLDLFTGEKIYYHHDAGYSLPIERIKESPLRFTWVYKNPEYYIADRKAFINDSSVAVISNGPIKKLPDYIEQKIKGYERKEVFKTSTGIFRYNPVVTIYLPATSYK